MRTIIKSTSTIEEYKRLQQDMRQKAIYFSNLHKKAVENWSEGVITKIWLDNDCNICIEYESGKWWHYNDHGEWW